MYSTAILVALVLLGGCSELASIEPDVCGNGVVEVNEDCDSNLDHCRDCSLACDKDVEICATVGGPGFVCGPDGLCHAPAGSFVHAAQVRVAVDSYRIANVNVGEDLIGDVIAQSGSSVSVLYGDFAGSLSASSSVQSPVAQGPVTFAKLDEDDIPDLLVPTIDGIAAFTFGLGVPAPYTFPKLIAEVDEGEPLMTFNIGGRFLGGVIDKGTGLELIVLDVGQGPEKVVASISLCGATAAEFSEKRSHVHVIPSVLIPPVTLHAVFTTIVSSNGQGRVCAIALDEIATGSTPPSPFTLTVIAAGTPALAPTERGVLVALEATGCPSLIVEDKLGRLLGLPADPKGTPVVPCMFGSSTPIQRLDLGGQLKAGGAPLGALQLDGSDVGIVLTDGVYVYVPPDATLGPRVRQLYASDRVLDGAEALHLDVDQKFDLVARAASSDDLDLLYRIPFPMPNVYGFLRVRFDTDEVVERVLPGDYDGNSRTDIAYVESVDGVHRLMIAYGSSDRPLPGQAVGSFEGLFSMIRVNIPDATDPFEVVDDLIVLYGTGAAKRLAVLHGSPQRTMQAFFDPRNELEGVPFGTINDDDVLLAAELAGVIPGRFGKGGGHDILGVATLRTPNMSLLYVTPTAPGGEISGAALCGGTNRLQHCTAVRLDQGDSADTDLCTNLASYVAWPKTATLDVVIGIDGFGNAATLDPALTGQCRPMPNVASANWSSELGLARRNAARRVRSIERVGFDSSELAISFAPGRFGSPVDAAIRICTIENGSGVSCKDPAELVAAHVGIPVVCGDLASGRATAVSRFGNAPPPIDDLFAVCEQPGGRSVYRLSRLSDQATDVAMLFSIGQGEEIEVGDVNGDAIDDIVVLERGATESILHVYTQCTSRNTADCEKEKTP